MSTLQFLREKAGVFVAGIIGLSLFLFVIGDFFGNGRGQRKQAKKYYEIGNIANEYISYQDYEERVQSLFEIYKLSGTSTIDESTSESIREQVWQQMVREIIQDKHYKKLGIDVSNEEVDELVLGNDPHAIVRQLFTDQSTGTFNKSALVNFLKQTEVDESAKKYWLFFEDGIVDDRMNAKYNSLVSKGLYVTSKQAEFDKALSGNTVDFSFVLKKYSSVSDSSVIVSKSEIDAYYEKNNESYKQEAARDIEYVAFEVKPSEDDIMQAEQWISKQKNEFTASSTPAEFINLTADTRYTGFYVPLSSVSENLQGFIKAESKSEVFGPYQEDGSFKLARLIDAADRPDSVHARHILLTPGQTRPLEQTRLAADSLIRLIKSGTKFETLAMAASDDKGSAQLGGDLGWFQEGRMIVPFNNACFSAKKGDVIKVETTYGVHVIEILATSKTSRKYNIGYVDRKVIAGSATNQKVYSEASQFAGTNNTYEKFNNAVAAQKLNKRVANNVTPQQKTLPGLENPRYLIMSLFQAAEAGKIILDNSQQAVFEVGDTYIVAFCTKIKEEGIAPIADVKNDIVYAIRKDKKADIISADFKKNTGASLDEVANKMGLTVQEATQINFRSYTVPGAGTEPALVAAASAAKQGSVEGPVKGNNGVYMIYITNQTKAEDQDMKQLKERLTMTYQMRGSYEAYEALRKDAKIVDKRYKFY
jgi:peptidyl-prolyl cis-trans isomerase D